MTSPLEVHYPLVVQAIRNGNLVPFLGAGINLCGHPLPNISKNGSWSPDVSYLPNDSELAAHLAAKLGLAAGKATGPYGLVHVFQHAVTTGKDGDLWDLVASLKLGDREPTPQPEAIWDPAGKFLPTGPQLARYIAREYAYPYSDDSDLVRVCQYVAVMAGHGPLVDFLHTAFKNKYEVTSAHRFLARLPTLFREARAKAGFAPELELPYPVFVTTNYDDLLETALSEENQPFDLLYYISYGEHRGKFMHRAATGDENIVLRPDEYTDLQLHERPSILKIHGQIQRDAVTAEEDSIVITEDDYIDYLGRIDIEAGMVPKQLLRQMMRSNFLFLGYGLRDWNLRAFLHVISQKRRLLYRSWAIQLSPNELDKKSWLSRDVEIIEMPLEEYIGGLEALFPAPTGS